MTWYEQRPPRIEVKHWTGDNLADIQAWAGEGRVTVSDEDPTQLWVRMLPGEGMSLTSLGDYVCRNDGDRLTSRTALEIEGGSGVVAKWQVIPDPVV